MIVTDKEVKRQLRIVNIPELTEMVEGYPEDEIDGRSEMDILKNEAGYLYEMFTDDGTVFSEGLEEAKEWLKETRNGTVFSGMLDSRALARAKRQTELAKNAVNEYNRLCNLMKRLRRL